MSRRKTGLQQYYRAEHTCTPSSRDVGAKRRPVAQMRLPPWRRIRRRAGLRLPRRAEEAEAAKAKAPEALSHALNNPSRVTPAQQKFVAYDEASRWRPDP